MFNSAASRQAPSSCRFSSIGQRGVRRWLGLNYPRILMGDLTCSLLNHLNPALFFEGKDVREKFMSFSRLRLHGCLSLLQQTIALLLLM